MDAARPRTAGLIAGPLRSAARRKEASPGPWPAIGPTERSCSESLILLAFYLSVLKPCPMTASTTHIPVMPSEVLWWLDPRPGQTILDGTAGGGGHAKLLAERVGPAGRVWAVDRDPAAVARLRRLARELPLVPVHSAYDELEEGGHLPEGGFDGALFDLGLSSDQLEDASRGFSFQSSGELDLRFDPSSGRPAWQLLEELSQEELADVIFRYGEERFSRRIARRIVERRRQRPIRTSAELASLIRQCVPRSRGHRIDPATRTFQALRIAVNDELGRLERLLQLLPRWVKPGGRVVFLSFHSLEDRLVKRAFLQREVWERLTKKPVRPTATEIAANPRSRSAKLRAARRVPPEEGQQ